MIAYEELSAALERWRVKNGLPGTPPLFADGSAMSRPAAPSAAAAAAPAYGAPAYSAPAYSAPAYDSGPASYGSAPAYDSGPAYAPPPVAPPAPRVPPPPSSETFDESVDEFADDDVLDEAALDNEGPDFAMSFDSAAPASPRRGPAALLSEEEERESTMIGSTNPSLVPPEDEDEFNAAEKTPV